MQTVTVTSVYLDNAGKALPDFEVKHGDSWYEVICKMWRAFDTLETIDETRDDPLLSFIQKFDRQGGTK